MMPMANSLLTIMRGTAVNEYGDESDVGTPLYEHIPACVVETTTKTFDSATQRPQMIRASQCVVPSWADVLTTDTILREDTGDYFMIEDIEAQPSFGYPADKLLTLRWRSGVSVSSD